MTGWGLVTFRRGKRGERGLVCVWHIITVRRLRFYRHLSTHVRTFVRACCLKEKRAHAALAHDRVFTYLHLVSSLCVCVLMHVHTHARAYNLRTHVRTFLHTYLHAMPSEA